jgi:hypothetical protein
VERLGTMLHTLEGVRRQANADLAAGAGAPATSHEIMGLDLRPGDRVFDLVTGQFGVIVSATRANYLAPPAGG